jgi:hypothetical protein
VLLKQKQELDRTLRALRNQAHGEP